MPSDTDVRAALEPFAACAERVHESTEDDRLLDVFTVGSPLTVGDLRRARTALAALQPSTAISEDRARDLLVDRIAEVMQEDGGCWSACSGCQESNDGCVSTRDYPYSSLFKCQPGAGCRECGGIGVLWQDGEFLSGYADAAMLAFARETTPPVEGAGDLLRPCDDQCGCVLCRADAYADAGYTPAPVDDISYAGAEMEDGPATHPVDAGEVERLTHVIDRDRYVAAHCLGEIEQAIARRSWLSEPGRGSYAYDDERYQQEFGAALTEIEAALAPLRRLSKDKTDCTRDEEKVRAARADAATIVSTPTASEETVRLREARNEAYRRCAAIARNFAEEVNGDGVLLHNPAAISSGNEIAHRICIARQALTMEGEGD